jgi:ribonuclease III
VKAALSELESAIGYSFSNPDLLVRALTHRSLANEQAIKRGDRQASAENERLEFLGDAVLGLVAAEAMYLDYPDWREGEFTRLRARVVSRRHLADVGASLDLGTHLRLGRGEPNAVRRNHTVLSNALESVIGAMFLDGGLEPVRNMVRRHVMGNVIEELARQLRSGANLGDYKSALQKHLQSTGAAAPVYRVKNQSDFDSEKRFLVEVRLRPAVGEKGQHLAVGLGRNKKSAEQDAARRALARLAKSADESEPEQSLVPVVKPRARIQESAAE